MKLHAVLAAALALALAAPSPAATGRHSKHFHKLAAAPAAPPAAPAAPMLTGVDRDRARLVLAAPLVPVVYQPVAQMIGQGYWVTAPVVATAVPAWPVAPLLTAAPVIAAVPALPVRPAATVVLSQYVTGY